MAFETLEDFERNGPKKTVVDPQIAKLLAARKAPTTEALTQGLDSTVGFTQPNTNQFSAALGGPVDTSGSIADALQLRSRNRSQDYINSVKKDVALTSPLREARLDRQKMGDYGKLASIEMDNDKIQKQHQLDRRRIQLYRQQKQDSILTGILGFLGTVGGAMVGAAIGGPAGAVAGAGAGSKAGGK